MNNGPTDLEEAVLLTIERDNPLRLFSERGGLDLVWNRNPTAPTSRPPSVARFECPHGSGCQIFLGKISLNFVYLLIK
jgi:hypothetical protein